MLEQKRAGWRSSEHVRSWLRSLELYAFPRIGKVPVSEVTSADVLEILTPIWHTKGQTARTVHLKVVWTVPAGRMKTGREHRVPLCRRALEILDAARRLVGGGSTIVFVSERGKSLRAERLGRLLKRHRIAVVPHGFRSSFRDWAAEETDHPREVVEAALAHVVRNKVEAAYRRSDLFERRRRLMNDWAAYLAGEHRDPEAGPVR